MVILVIIMCYLTIGIIFGICAMRSYIKDTTSYNSPITKTEALIGSVILAVAWPIVCLVALIM